MGGSRAVAHLGAERWELCQYHLPEIMAMVEGLMDQIWSRGPEQHRPRTRHAIG